MRISTIQRNVSSLKSNSSRVSHRYFSTQKLQNTVINFRYLDETIPSKTNTTLDLSYVSRNGMLSHFPFVRNSITRNNIFYQLLQQRNYAVADESVIGEVDKEFQSMVTFRDKTAKDVLEGKSIKNKIHFVYDDEMVFDSIKIMKDINVGAVLVIKNVEHTNLKEHQTSYLPINAPFDKELLLGMLSERDYLTKVILVGKRSSSTQVKEIMTDPVITVKENATAAHCMHIMTHSKVRHLPVLNENGDQVIGVLSIGDLIKYILHEQKETIHFMRNYIERTY